MNWLQKRLWVKLLLSYLLVVLVGVVALAVVASVSLPGAYNRHMAMMSQDDMQTMMGGRGLGRGNGGLPGQLYQNVRSVLADALTVAGTAAVVVALLASLFFAGRLVAPLRAMTAASRRIAAGHYGERVPVDGRDELAELAGSFNQMAGALEQTEAMRRKLIGDVAHELRTPLAAVKGTVEGLIDGVLPATPETLAQIGRETDRLARLVDDLQELSRVEAQAYKLDKTDVDLRDVVQTVAGRLDAQFAAQRIELRLDLPPQPVRILADEGRLVQVLTNLTANALQYTPEGGNVTVELTRADGEIRVSVCDTGIGIPAEHLERIFDRFYRVDASRSRRAGGSGIGLAVAKSLVEAHGGRIWAESGGEGKGSRFMFALPDSMGR
jgi:histidine kinase